MNFQCYIAMTAAEYSNCQILPENVAWMACHFSCYGTGLSNFPQSLQKDSMLIINDKLPPYGHDPVYIAQQLQELKELSGFSCILLDFQREECPEGVQIAKEIVLSLECPVGISETYAHCVDGPVFINCPRPHCPLSEKLKLWQGRELWLEAAVETETAIIYPDHCKISFGSLASEEDSDSVSNELRSRYRIMRKSDHVELTLYRDILQTEQMIQDAKQSGVAKVVGLYQQLGALRISTK